MIRFHSNEAIFEYYESKLKEALGETPLCQEVLESSHKSAEEIETWRKSLAEEDRVKIREVLDRIHDDLSNLPVGTRTEYFVVLPPAPERVPK